MQKKKSAPDNEVTSCRHNFTPDAMRFYQDPGKVPLAFTYFILPFNISDRRQRRNKLHITSYFLDVASRVKQRPTLCFALLLSCHFLLSFNAPAQPPIITSFAPISGPIGTSVTISGINFNPTAANNIVYFGAVKAVVAAATTTSLTVTVPIGTTYQPITVTTANFTAYSSQPFIVTFPSNAAGITANSFAAKTDFVCGYDPETLAIADFDGDGKTDMVTANRNANSISVLRNTGITGTVSFAAKVDYATGASPVYIATGDFDGDGKPDLAVANNGSNTISLFKNTSTTGTISFAAKVDYASRNGPNSIAIGDIDGDGKPDLAIANIAAPDLVVFKNTSAGGTISFSPGPDLFIGSYANIGIGDVDGDGKPDLVGTDRGSTLSVSRNTSASGSISFAPVVYFTTATNNSTLSMGDIDGDGKPDVAVTSYSNVISVLRNTSSSGMVSFATKVDFATGNNPRGLSIGNLDGDGKPDLAVANSGAATVSVLRNTSTSGTISFAAKLDYATGQYPYCVAIGDLDGDGKPDLSVGNHDYTSSTISVFKNQTDGPNIASFTPANGNTGTSIIITGTSFTGATAVSIGGIAATSFIVNSDTQITAVVAAVAGGSIVVTTPNGMAKLGGFYNGPAISSVSPLTGPVGTAVTITGTNFNPVAANNIVYFGAVKAAVTAASSTSLAATAPPGITYEPLTVTTGNRTAYSNSTFGVTFPANSTGLTANSFAAKVDYSISNGSNGVVIGDLDGDGKGDMVSANYTYNAIFVYRNTGTPGSTSFTAGNIISSASVTSVALSDVDGDGKLDIIATNYNGGIVSVFKNTSTIGAISFAAKADVATVSSPASVSVSDVDGDGKPDLAVVQSGSSIVSLFRNTTSGGVISFGSKTDVSINSVTKVVLGDIDGDGKPEMVVANYYAGTVSVLKNNSIAGLISFAPQIDFTTGSNSTGAAIGDLDGDGKPDLAVTNSASNTVSVLKNNSSVGTITFGAAVNFATGAGPSVISIADIDGDGKPDLTVANATAYSVSVLKNNSAGTISFAAKIDYTTGGNISHIATGDLDGDGKPDMAITNSNQGTVSVLRNQTAGTDIFSFTPANTGVGTSITITGINFTGATAVSLGGKPVASFSVLNDMQISAVVGAVAGGAVSVTSPKGTATLNGFYNGPVINSFAPASGPIGTFVTITGTNFNATAAGNTVYFGAVKAVVTSATSTSLTVTVPIGATYQPITVTTSNYTAYSGKPFLVTFPANAPLFTPNTFDTKIDYAAGTNPACVAIGDLDGDGKSELVVANYNSNIVSIYKNGSVSGTVSFAANVVVGSGYYPTNIAIGDINGDGKPDLAIVSLNSVDIEIYVNTSIGTTISFATPVSIYAGLGSQPRSVVIGDLDGDGRPDMAMANTSTYGPLSVFRNTGTAATISFAPKQEFADAGGRPYSIAMGDFDGDGKPDLALTDYVFTGTFVTVVSVFKNQSVVGAISLGDRKDFVIGGSSQSVATGDFNGDGKIDLAVGNYSSGSVSVLRNTTSGSVISFATKIDYATGINPYGVAVGDFDGDEKPDLAVANAGSNTVSVLKNIGTGGAISFATKVDYTTGNTPYSVAIGDLDGDGQPDMTIANYGSNTVSVLRNQIGAPNISSFAPVNAGVASTVTINGSGFIGAVAVSFGGMAASSFTIVSDNVITAVVGAVAGGNASVTTPKGTAVLSGFYNGPVITTFTPSSGPVGTLVTITGTNFNPVAANNIVYFGAVKAVVSAASATSLTVTVPAGNTYQPLSVTTSNLTAYASKPFIQTFPANSAGFASGSFAAKTDFTTATNPYSLGISDLDGDGKPDMALVNINSNSISVFRNIGSTGTVSFAPKADYVTGTAPASIFIGDLDGDGKPDIVVPNFSSGTVSVFKNVSTVGTISFAAKVDFVTAPNPKYVAMGDVNGDGKPELVVVNSTNTGSTVSVFKNTTAGGAISFATKLDYVTERYPGPVAISDLDGDGKPDLTIANTADYSISLFKNTGAGGSISFAGRTDVATTGTSYGIAVGDLDGDGKGDIAVTNYGSGLVSIFRNTSTTGTISLAAKVDFATGINPQNVAIADLDGDGKPDLAIPDYGFGVNTISVLKNSSTSGILSFSAKADYATGVSPIAASIGDMDGDGKPDLAIVNYGANAVSILKNQLAGTDLCTGGSVSYTSNITGASYQWQLNTGSGFAAISNNSNYAGSGTATLQLSNLPTAWYGYQYRCLVDGVNSNTFTLQFTNTWTGAINTAWENGGNWSCGVVPDGNTDVVIGTGTVVVSSAATCRSLKVNSTVNFTVSSGYTVTVAH